MGTIQSLIDVKLVTKSKEGVTDGRPWIRWLVHTNQGKMSTFDGDIKKFEGKPAEAEYEVTPEGYMNLLKFWPAKDPAVPAGNGNPPPITRVADLASVQSARERLEILERQLADVLKIVKEIRSKFS
jgi:hypothetical protein